MVRKSGSEIIRSHRTFLSVDREVSEGVVEALSSTKLQARTTLQPHAVHLGHRVCQRLQCDGTQFSPSSVQIYGLPVGASKEPQLAYGQYSMRRLIGKPTTVQLGWLRRTRRRRQFEVENVVVSGPIGPPIVRWRRWRM